MNQEENRNSHNKLAMAIQDAALQNLNEDIQSMHDQLQQISDMLPNIMDQSVNLFTSQLDDTLGAKIASVDDSLTKAEHTLSRIEEIKEEVVSKAQSDFERTKIAFLNGMDEYIKLKTEPVFESMDAARKEIENAVKLSQQTRQQSNLKSVVISTLSYTFVGMAAAFSGGYIFTAAVQHGWIL